MTELKALPGFAWRPQENAGNIPILSAGTEARQRAQLGGSDHVRPLRLPVQVVGAVVLPFPELYG